MAVSVLFNSSSSSYYYYYSVIPLIVCNCYFNDMVNNSNERGIGIKHDGGYVPHYY
jgi:hypothetical protein